MEFQAWMQWLIPALSAILSTSGIWAMLAARSAGRATERSAIAAGIATERAAEAAGLATERAAALAAAPVSQQATTADWSSLMAYWQAEMATVRDSSTRMEIRLGIFEKQREEDLQHIEDLEQHIWNGKPPPPPARRTAPGSISGAFVITPDPPEGQQ
ncbi:MAG TPA: hypothetical protein VF867_06665 [Arthrobacter sp.]